MPNEAGDMKLIGNFRQLIDRVLAELNYKPANAALKVVGLNAQHAAALNAVEALNDALATYRLAVTDRLLAFEELAVRILRSRNLLRASGASKDLLADAETSVSKVRGKHKTKKAPAATGAPGAPGDASHSTSQMSYDNQLGNFKVYLSILTQVASYAPLEADLTLASLQAFAAELQAKNDAVSAAFAALGQARGMRDGLLYTNEDSVVAIAQLVKAYVNGAFGADSTLYKQIKGLPFKKAPK